MSVRLTPEEIILKYRDNGYPSMHIPNNKIWLTDVSTSTISWCEQNVVFEHYFLHAHAEIVMHSHPFRTCSIFISGKLQGWSHVKNENAKWNNGAENRGKIGGILEPGIPHGFRVGPEGAIIYTVQIWPEDVINPVSATVEYLGEPLGPLHSTSLRLEKLRKMMKERELNGQA